MAQSPCGCGCGPTQLTTPQPAQDQPTTPQSLSADLTWRDTLGGWAVRWRINRMGYQVSPGLYRIGQPGAGSPVLVTANYKLTVDSVRRHVKGLDIWLLVLDTKGVNVWCAAGKGTFSTAELVRRVQATGLARIVHHRELILPQLSATGVAAHEVKKACGFSVHYGPIRAADIAAYLAAGRKATARMRRVSFNWKERLVVTPVEVVGTFKYLLLGLAVLAVLSLLARRSLSAHLILDLAPFAAAVLAGCVLVPLLLPWLPFRHFSLKGALLGACLAAALPFLIPRTALETAGVALLAIAITSYKALTFTGSTTFTTLSGVRTEVRRALPAIIVAASLGAVLRIIGEFV